MNKALKAVFLYIIFCLSGITMVSANHLMGGDVTYKNLGNNRVALQFMVYRDCNVTGNAQLDASITYRLYPGSRVAKKDYTNYISRTVKLFSKKTVQPEAPHCTANICVEKGIYLDTITEGSDTMGYHVTWYSVKRNYALDNFKTDNCTGFGTKYPFGMIWYTYLPPTSIKNNSPQFLTSPIPYLCAGRKMVFNPVVTDADKDSLVYSLEVPYSPDATTTCNAGGTQPTPYPPGHSTFSTLTYQTGYSLTYPFGTSSPAVAINSTNGEITVTANTAGNYVLAIQVMEYRVNPVTKKSTYVGMIRRDLQFVVGTCSSNASPVFKPDSLGYTRYAKPGDTLCFSLTGADATDSVFLWAQGGIFKDQAQIPSPYASFSSASGYKKVTSNFCWAPTCEQITYTSPYSVTFYLADDACNIVTKTYSIYVKSRPILKPPQILCVDAVNKSSLKITWQDTLNTDSIKKNFFRYYKIYKRTGATGSFVKVDSITTYSTKSWTDTKAANNDTTLYSYYITAQNDCGLEGLESDTFSNLVIRQQKLNDRQVKIYWARQSYHPTWYKIWTDKGSGFTAIDSTQSLNYIFSSCNSAFNTRISVTGPTHTCTSYSNTQSISIKDTTPPDMTGLLTNVLNVGYANNQLNVVFKAPSDPDLGKYELYRAVNNGAFSLYQTLAKTVTTYSDKNVHTADTLYSYKIFAVDSCGNRGKASTVHTPVLLKGTGQHLSNRLYWKPYVGYTADSINVYQLNGTTPVLLARLKGSDTSFVHPGLKCGTTYTYYIVSLNPAGKNPNYTIYSQSNTVTLTPTDTIAPEQVNVVSASVNAGNTSVKVTWNKVNDKDIRQYEIYMSTNGGAYSLQKTVSYTTASQFTADISVTNPIKNTYNFKVLAVDSCMGNRSKTFEVHSPVEMTGKAMELSNKLNWTKYKGFIVKNYVVQKLSGASWIDLVTLTSTDSTWTDTAQQCNIIKFYRIKANENAGDNANSLSDTIGLTPFDTVRPAQVNIRSVSVLTSSSIQIQFDKVSDKDVKQYDIYYSVNGGSYSFLNSITKPASNTISYTQTGLSTQSKSYSYRVYAVDSCASNKSLTSETHTAVLLKGSNKNLSNQLNWYKYKGFNVKNYIVQKLSNKVWTDLVALTSSDTAYLDTAQQCNVAKFYRIKAVENAGDNASVLSDSISLTPYDTIKPAKPVIRYVSVSGNTSISLQWAKSTSADVKDYIIFRKVSTASSFSAIDTVHNRDTVYTDKKVNAANNAYCYAVQAMDSCAANLSALSDMHCTELLTTSLSNCQQKINLNWTPYVGWKTSLDKYEIYRSVDGGTSSLLTSVSSAANSYADNTANFRHSYTYLIKGLSKGSVIYSSWSEKATNRPFQPDTPQVLFASKVITDYSAGSVLVKWRSQLKSRYIKYSELYYRAPGASGFSLLKGNILPGVDSFLHTGLNTRSRNHEYYLISYDSCGNKSDSMSTHQTIELSMTVGQLTHSLKWTAYKGWPVKGYIIQYRIGGKYTNVDTVPATQTTLKRQPMPCNVAVYYRVGALSFKGDVAYSDTAAGQAIDTIPANAPIVSNATVLSSSSVKIDFRGADSADVYGYSIERSDNGGNFQTAGFVYYTTAGGKMTFTDKVNTQTGYHCYAVVTLDSCLNATNSDTFCTIYLNGKALNQANSLKWKPFRGYKIDHYELQTWNSSQWVKLKDFKITDSSFLHTPLTCWVPRYYRLKGFESGGLRTTLSDSLQLIPYDSIIPAAPKVRYATAVSGKGIKLEWNWDPKSDVKYFEIWRKDLSNPVFSRIKTLTYDSVYTDPVTNLNKGYAYYIIAIDSCDSRHRSPSSDVEQTMQLNMQTGACVPLVRLKWNAYKNLLNGVSSYSVYRSDAGGSFNLVKTLVSGDTSWVDSTVSVKTRYTYCIKASGYSSPYTSFSDTLSIIPVKWQPSLPVSLRRVTVTRTGTTNGAILIEWNKAGATDTFARGYRIYTSNQPGGPFTLLHDEPNLGVTSFISNGINTSSLHHFFYIVTYNLCNVESQPSAIHESVNLQATNANLLVALRWNKYIGFNVDHYELYKSTNNRGLRLIASLANTDSTFSDTSLSCQIPYTYYIKVFEKGGNSLTSSSDSISIVAFDTIPPRKAAVTLATVAITGTSAGSVQVLFRGAAEANRAGYVVYRSISSGPYLSIDTFFDTKLGPHVYVDNSLNTAKQNYAYYFRSIDSCGNIAMPSDTHRVMNLRAMARNTRNVLHWTAYKGFANYSYQVERRVYGTPNWKPIATVPMQTDSIEDFKVSCHINYEYRIMAAADLANNIVSYSNTDTARAFENNLPIVPDIVEVTVTATDINKGQTLLQWHPSVSADVAIYHVYRRLPAQQWALVTSLQADDTFYNDINLNTYRSSYEYTVRSEDSCGNLSLDNAEVHRNMVLKAVAGNQKVTLNWSPYVGFSVSRYEVYRDKALLTTLAGSTVSFTDTFVICKTKYQYIVKAVGSLPGEESESNFDTVRAYDMIGPRASYIATASVINPNKDIQVLWTKSPSYDVAGYKLYRRVGTQLSLIYTAVKPTDTSFTDHFAIEGQDICYFVDPFDYCGNTGNRSNPACIILLNGSRDKLIHSLNWNAYQLWHGGVSAYNIYRMEDFGSWQPIGKVNGNTYSYRDSIVPDPAANTHDYCYRVEAIEGPGSRNQSSYSTMICLQQQPIVWVPNAFTPEMSYNLNDAFGPKGIYFTRYDMQIYNRWGEMIYSTDNGTPWTGRKGSDFVQEGLYMYRITIHGFDRRDYQYNGIVNLLR